MLRHCAHAAAVSVKRLLFQAHLARTSRHCSICVCRPPGAADEGSLPPCPPGPSGLPSPTPAGPHSSPGSGWATLRQRTGLGGSPDRPGASKLATSLAQFGAPPSKAGGSPVRSGAVGGLQQGAGGGLQRGFGSHVSLPTLDDQGTGALQQVSHSRRHIYVARFTSSAYLVLWAAPNPSLLRRLSPG